MALAPAIAAASAKLTSSGHQRRSEIPASASSMPGRSPAAASDSANCSSKSFEVTTIGASAMATDTMAVSR